MNVDFVNRVDGGAGVGIGRQQGALGVGINFSGFVQKPNAIHLRHALIGQQQRDRVVADPEFAQDSQPRITGVGAQHPIFLAVAGPQVALNCLQTLGSSSTVSSVGLAMPDSPSSVYRQRRFFLR